MKRALAAFLCLALTWTQAFAQTVQGPQTVNPPQVVSGADATGTLTGRQVQFTDLSFAGIFGQPTTSSTQAEVDFGNKTFILDSDPGFKTEYTVEITPAGEYGPMMIGVISNIDTTSGQTVITVAVFRSIGGGIFTNWNLKVIGGPTIAIPAFISVGISTSSFTAPTTLGTTVSLTTDAGKAYAQNTIVYIAGFGDNSSGFFADVISYDSSTGAMVAFSVSNSGSGATLANWSVAIVTPAGPDAALIGYSSTSLTLGAGDFTFTTQAGQFFPIQGQMLASCLGTTNRMAGFVKAYTSTSLILTVTSNGVYGSGTCAAWSLYLTTGPTTRISLYQMNGLQMPFSGTNVIVNAGSVRDSTDTIDLSLASPTTLSFAAGSSDLVSVAGPGTISSAASAVTGTSTVFTTTFSAAATLTDLSSQLTALSLSAVTFPSVITTVTSARSAATTTVGLDTAMTTNGPLGASGDTYARGGIQTVQATIAYGITLAYKTSDGTTKLTATSFTKSGVPDLPAGYSYYRVIGYVIVGISGIISTGQPLATNALTTAGDVPYFGSAAGPGATYQSYLQRLPIGRTGQGLTVQGGLPAWGGASTVPTAVYSATITPTAVTGSVSSVNASTDVVTWSTTHGLTTGEVIRGIGTVPAGWTVAQPYYVNALSGTTFALYTTYANAVADTSRVNITATTTGATMVNYIHSSIFNVGFVTTTNGAIGGTTGSTSMALDYNLANALATTAGATSTSVTNLFTTAPAQAAVWLVMPPETFTSTTLVQIPNVNFWGTSGLTLHPGTWAQQGTNAFQIRVWVWGALDEPIPANDNDLILKAVA